MRILDLSLLGLLCVRRTAAIGLLLFASTSSAAMSNSDINYPGASADQAFVAEEPYVLNIQGVNTTVSLGGSRRAFDFGGNTSFINSNTQQNDPFVFQARSKEGALVDWYGSLIKVEGVPGRIEKTSFGTDDVTMIKYNANDDIAFEKCRTKLGTYPVPPRTRVRWELEVAFGKGDAANEWTMTPSSHWGQDSSGKWIIDNGGSPVLFWALTSHSQSNGPLSLDVDTDDTDPTKLMISAGERVGTATSKTAIGTRVRGIPRHTLVPIVIDAFLDERSIADGGKGSLQIWINNKLAVDKVGPTLALGTQPHYWAITTYLWNEAEPYQYSRAAFFKKAKMMVYPVNVTPPAVTETLLGSLDPAAVDLSDGVNYELGMKFSSLSAGTIDAIRFYKSPSETGTHTGKIYSASGDLLASVVFTNETPSGYQEQKLINSLSIKANTSYVVSVNTGNTVYGRTVNSTGSQLSGTNLSTVGSYGVYGPVGAMPAGSNNANYFRDIVFTPVIKENLLESLNPAAVNLSDGANFELGMKFSSLSAGIIDAIRFYKSPNETGTHTGKIYSASGDLLASVVFTNETASGYQVQKLATPLPIAANTFYVVSVNTGNFIYAKTVNSVGSQISSANLRSTVGNYGVYGPIGSMPASSNNSNYFRDILFSPKP